MTSAYASTVATAVLIAASSFSVTKFEPIFEQFGQDLPTATLLLMGSYKYWPLVPVASLLCLVYARQRGSRTAYIGLQVLLGIAVLSFPFACTGIYAPVASS